MTVKARFAPSPTGYLHVGNVRTALVNYLFVKKMGGEFLLRIDDTDTERSKPEYEAAIKKDLEWLGLNWNRIEHQSQRFDRYKLAAEKLTEAGRLYPCYETPEELDIQRKMLASRGLPPIYKRATDEQNKKYVSEGRKAHYRFALHNEEVQWDDLIRGHVAMKASTMSDPVLIRADGVPVYTLASVVDDGEMGITHVIRGEDHVSNTAVQIQIYKALGFGVPQFAHMALLKTKEGELSKRLGGNDIRSLREAGILPMAVNSLLARIGTSDPVEAFADMKPLIDAFDFKKFGRAPAIYDPEDMPKLSSKLFRLLSYETVRQMIEEDEEYKKYLRYQFTPDFWNKIHHNVRNLSDLKDWIDIFFRESFNRDRLGEYKDVLNIAADILDREIQGNPSGFVEKRWTEETWKNWISLIQKHFADQGISKKGKDIYMPLRLALTNKSEGPDLKDVFLVLSNYGADKDKITSHLRFFSNNVSYGGESY